MSETLRWWFMLQVVGLAALPLCLTLFRSLPDRGYTLSKPFALLLVGYVFWIFVIIGLPNTTGSIWLILVLFFAASGLLFWRRRDEFLGFLRERWWLIAGTEALFFLAFVTAAYLRSFVPDLGGTEKPMDLMFLNAVTRGDSFPPADLWLAGENVSYYYFGYLLVSIMTRLSGLATSIGFNLGLAMIVALTVTAAFGLVYNLAAPREERAATAGPGTPAKGFSSRVLWRPMAFGITAALLLAVMGNLEGLLEWLAAHSVGSSGFWSWASVSGLSSDTVSARWYPDNFWFWWKATRILDGGVGIHEFPFFSFLLGDLHPHVMSIPFVLLAIGAALALLRSEGPLDLVFWLERPLSLIGLAVILGGLAFLNTWDLPTTAAVMVMIALLRNRLLADRWSWGLILDTMGFLVPLFFVASLAYIPFFFGGFTSQASGFTAEAGAGSGLFHTLLLWGPFAVLVLPYAAWRLTRSEQPITLRTVLWSLSPAVAIVALWVAWDLLASVLGWLPATLQLNDARTGIWERIGERGWNWLTVLVVGSALGLLVLALAREVEAKRSQEERVGHVFALALAAIAALLILGVEFVFIQDGFNSRMNSIFKLYYQSWLLLSIAGGFALYELTHGLQLPKVTIPRNSTFTASFGNWAIGEVFVTSVTLVGAVVGVMLMADILTRLIGAVVIGGVFYATSAAGIVLWRSSAHRFEQSAIVGALSWRAVWLGGAAIVLLAAFVYPLIATWNRTEGCVAHPVRLLEGSERCGDIFANRTLDGLARIDPTELSAIQWLADQDGQPVIAEALGGDYSEGGRVSASTGLPTLLQWPGHELQWRGDSSLQAGRPEDIDRIYTSSDADEIREVIKRYDIAFVYLGRLERQAYPVLTLPEMTELFEPAFEQGEVIVYRVRPGIRTELIRE